MTENCLTQQKVQASMKLVFPARSEAILEKSLKAALCLPQLADL
jgi:hypothetical protein